MHQAGQRKSTMRPLIDAHRGECGNPGLPAAERYIRSIAMGVDFVEIDTVSYTHLTLPTKA